MGAVGDELAKLLNLPRTAPGFVLRRDPRTDEVTVINPSVVPNDGADYWVAATTSLRCGREVPTVVLVYPGGETGKFYWYAEDTWLESDDPETQKALGLSRDQIFPFDWSYAVPLEVDPYHD